MSDPRAFRELLDKLGNLEGPKRAEAEILLRQISQITDANPLELFNHPSLRKPHPKQDQFLASQDRVKAFFGGNRSGKSTAGLVDDIIQAVDGEVVPDRLIKYKKWAPPFRCRILVPGEHLIDGNLRQTIMKWVPRSQLLDGDWTKAYQSSRRILHFANGSWFQFMTYKQDLDQFGGVALHRVHYDEEPPEAIRSECKARLIDFRGDELFTMTPQLGMTWVADAIWEKRGQDGITFIEVSMDDNPHISPEEIEEYFAGMSPEEAQARRHGKMVFFGGLVLRGFDDEQHVVKPIEDKDFLKDKTVIVGIDPGIARAGVVFCAFDKDDTMLVFDELYPKDMHVELLAREIRKKLKDWDIEPDYFVIDPSSRNRSLAGGDDVLSEFARHGIYCAKGQNDRESGVLQLRRRIWAKEPRLLVTANCTNWLWEKNRWRVEQDENDGKGDTFKTSGPDHLMDATKYVAMERFWGPPVERKSSSNPFGSRVSPGDIAQPWKRRPVDAPPTGALT